MRGENITDIIIPIYNAYDDLKICLESIYRHTDLDNNRLILINDNSPDPRIKELLDKQNKDNVIVIHNDSNKGFSANINIGMAQSETNDVLLLNSDTIVTGRWIEKIRECAYSEKFIGTVTPVSNNATLCSVPVFCEENQLPDNMSVDMAAEIVERCSLKSYPQITVAHGFCMYVKREVIDAIGNFDAVTFERGYGEENDFCNRAGQIGYKHVMCDDTFILHTGTKSFVSAEKEAYIEKHDRILRERYAVQMHENDVHVRDNPNGYVGENVGIFWNVFNGKKNILYVLQSDFREDANDHVGGTQLHVKHLANEMKHNYNVFVAARDGEYLNLTFYSDDKRLSWKFYIGKKSEYYEFSNKSMDKIWRNILSAFHIDCVHVHHLYTTSFDIVYVANEYNIPVVYTFHDFFMISPSLKLLDTQDRVITKEVEKEDSWNRYLEKNCNVNNGTGYIKNWRKRCLEILKMCNDIVVPNETGSQIIKEYYPEIAEKIHIIEHGYEFEKMTDSEVLYSEKVRYKVEDIYKAGNFYKFRGWAFVNGLDKKTAINTYIEIKTPDKKSGLIPTSKRIREDVSNVSGRLDSGFEAVIPREYIGVSDAKVTIVIITQDGKRYYSIDDYELPMLSKLPENENINIAFIGGINKEKGGKEICKLVKEYSQNVNWFLFGNVGMEELKNLKQDNFLWYNAYNSNDLPRLLDLYNIDVIGILSIWPETFSYTLTESLLCGRPVIVSDIGALGNRVNKLQCGWCVGLDDIQKSFSSIVKKLIYDKSILNEYKNNISQIHLGTLKDMAVAYEDLYQKNICDKAIYEKADYQFLYKSYVDRHYSINGEKNNKEDAKSDYFDLANEYRIVTNSLSYKAAKKFADMKIPGKMMLYKFVKKVIK